ncbi:MAG: bifunctional 5,10-methylenetetrahydrofolate dehydrogenase/5,10-methenyltetrahydrofolate cyclohydrolase [Clostridiaceae bacterium]|jgi:methylenetetrahydrofolate dehydrogenase (NADP+)/methenyltetrahydrofolate cyclohydrolase|nr:bifunctional 5,10-methylenetetrahydrofolate dehydrogenase/5,10-methenyltetrahydrofolate cyclohydrolase [Clostridiaceae bacterium]
MAQVLLGKEVADVLTEELVERVAKLKAGGVEPSLAIVRLGNEADDLSYERGALNRAEKAGVKVKVFDLPRDLPQEDLEQVILEINQDDSLHGCLIFRPLPGQIDEEKIAALLAPAKDIDGFTDGSLVGVFKGEQTGFAPCTAEAAIAILKHYNVNLNGARAVVLGRSLVIGKPVAMMLLQENSTVTICHSRTKEIAKAAKDADVLIAAVGQAKMVTPEFCNPGQVIIDVGINVDEEGKLLGDVDYDAVEPLVKAITPVPRGVGSVTTSILMKHVVEAAERATD